MTARTIRAWVPQRHRLLASAFLMSPSLGFLFLARNAADSMIMPLMQYPHCAACSSMKAFCTGCSFSGEPIHRRERRDAGAHRRAVDVDSASAALPEPAAEARAVKAKIVAQHVQQRYRRVVVFDRDPLAIHGKRLGFGHGRPPNPRTGIYAARTFASAPVALTPVTGAFLECFRHSPGPRIGVNYSILLGYTEGTVRPMSVPGSLGDLRAQLI